MSRMETKLYKISDIRSDSERIQEAAAILESGGLAAFPTETVYGIGCIVKADALDKLDNLKGGRAEKRYSLHIAGPDDLRRYVRNIGARAQKLIAEFWPGPLTIVFVPDEESFEFAKETLDKDTFDALFDAGTIGVRCPDNELCSALLGRVDLPVVASSANLSGKEPATKAEQVIEDFEGKIDAIVDGDPVFGCRYDENSSVVKVSSARIEMLREGVIKKEEIMEKSQVSICFVCTGNTCRSPMAEYICKKFISEKLNCNIDELGSLGYKVTSAGIMRGLRNPASPEVIDICSSLGVDASGHSSRSLNREDIEKSDFVFVMTQGHLEQISHYWPGAEVGCKRLDGCRDIADPIGASMSVYKACAEQIEQAVTERLGEILK